jgi:dihydrofolate reductase
MMRRIIYTMSTSLDGYIEGPGGDMSWAFPDEELHRFFNALEDDFDTHFYGRLMWEGMVGFWPTADENPELPAYVAEYAPIWRSKKKFVFSKTMEDGGEHATLIREVDPDEVRRIKAQPGKAISIGGPGLAATFMQHGLVDEFQLAVHPVVLGGGKPMFPPGVREQLTFVSAQTFASGVVFVRYTRG